MIGLCREEACRYYRLPRIKPPSWLGIRRKCKHPGIDHDSASFWKARGADSPYCLLFEDEAESKVEPHAKGATVTEEYTHDPMVIYRCIKHQGREVAISGARGTKLHISILHQSSAGLTLEQVDCLQVLLERASAALRDMCQA